MGDDLDEFDFGVEEVMEERAPLVAKWKRERESDRAKDGRKPRFDDIDRGRVPRGGQGDRRLVLDHLVLQTDRNHNGRLEFDRQYRPHIVLSFPTLVHPRNDRKKFDLLDLTKSQRQFVVERLEAAAISLFRNCNYDAIAFHCGKWADSWHFHCHIMGPLEAYFRLRASRFTAGRSQPEWETWDAYRRGWKGYSNRVLNDNAKYLVEDKAAAVKLLNAPVKRLQSPGEGVDRVKIDPDDAHATVIQFLGHNLESVLDTLNANQISTFQLFILPSGREIRVFVPIEVFILFLEIGERSNWIELWGDWGQKQDSKSVSERAIPGLDLHAELPVV